MISRSPGGSDKALGARVLASKRGVARGVEYSPSHGVVGSVGAIFVLCPFSPFSGALAFHLARAVCHVGVGRWKHGLASCYMSGAVG